MLLFALSFSSHACIFDFFFFGFIMSHSMAWDWDTPKEEIEMIQSFLKQPQQEKDQILGNSSFVSGNNLPLPHFHGQKDGKDVEVFACLDPDQNVHIPTEMMGRPTVLWTFSPTSGTTSFTLPSAVRHLETWQEWNKHRKRIIVEQLAVRFENIFMVSSCFHTPRVDIWGYAIECTRPDENGLYIPDTFSELDPEFLLEHPELDVEVFVHSSFPVFCMRDEYPLCGIHPFRNPFSYWEPAFGISVGENGYVQHVHRDTMIGSALVPFSLAPRHMTIGCFLDAEGHLIVHGSEQTPAYALSCHHDLPIVQDDIYLPALQPYASELHAFVLFGKVQCASTKTADSLRSSDFSIDASLIEINSDMRINADWSAGLGSEFQNIHCTGFLTPDQVQDFANTCSERTVLKKGATSGVTFGRLFGDAIQIKRQNLRYQNTTLEFLNVFLVESSNNQPFFKPGDSGSAVINTNGEILGFGNWTIFHNPLITVCMYAEPTLSWAEGALFFSS